MNPLAWLRRKAVAPEVAPPATGAPSKPFDFSPEACALIERVRPYTMTSDERVVHLRESVRYLVANRIEGDVVECGVWRGGSMMAVALTLRELGDTTRGLHLFDTFEGMPPPRAEDVDWSGRDAGALLQRTPRDEEDYVWAYAPLERVKQNLAGTGYPAERLHFVKGKVEDTLPAQAPARIALLRLDTDWYESTRHELATLYHRLVPGGVLIIDDYGWWKGARKATDEFFATLPFKPLLFRIDTTGRSSIKP